jgi:hypothetical protein
MGIYDDMKKDKTLRELFSFPGFLARQELEGRFGDPRSRIIILDRKKKQRAALNVALFALLLTQPPACTNKNMQVEECWQETLVPLQILSSV